jgi:putative aldouronate transport system substrate-binding protein
MRRNLFAVLVLAVLFSAGAWAAGSKEGQTIEAPGTPDASQQALKEPLGGLALPLSAKPIQLSMFIAEPPNYPIKDDLAVMVEMFKRTNIRIHFITVPQESEQEKKNVLLASGDLPDFVRITEADEQGNGKLFLELQDMIPKIAPNINARFTPAVKAFRETVPGKIYTVPWTEYQIGSLGFDYRLDYLQKMGFTSEPKTLDEWTVVLKKAKVTDLNGDGKLDTVPVVNRRGTVNMFQQMTGSFGLNMDGNSLFWRLEKGKAVFGPTTDRYRAMVEYCRMLYSEGLLDKEYSTLPSKDWEAKISTGVGFSTWDWFTRVSMFNDLMKDKEPTFRMARARRSDPSATPRCSRATR